MFFNYATKFLVVNKNIFFLAETQRNAKKKNLVPVPKSSSQTKRRSNYNCLFLRCN